MKKLLALAFLPLFFLVGCGDETAPSPEPTSSASAEQQYLDNLHNIKPETTSVSDRELVNTGMNACIALDNGTSLEEMFQTFYSNGVDLELAGAVVGAAVRDLCPEHQGTVNDYLDKPDSF